MCASFILFWCETSENVNPETTTGENVDNVCTTGDDCSEVVSE